MSRIQLTDTIPQTIIKIVEGNPGALNVCVMLMTQNENIDPDAAFGPLSSILALDTNEIYGSRIWMLYKDVCKQNIILVISTLRAIQLGFISQQQLDHAIDNYGEGIDVADLYKKVCEKLLNFKKITE